MRNHGVSVVASSIAMVVGRSITLEDNAAMQSDALARGDRVTYLELSEESMGSDFLRAWDLWKRRVSVGEP